MREKRFVIGLNQQVAQLNRYRKLLVTTIEYVGEASANEVFTIIPLDGKPMRCSPTQFVAVEEIMVAALTDLFRAVTESGDEELQRQLENFLCG